MSRARPLPRSGDRSKAMMVGIIGTFLVVAYGPTARMGCPGPDLLAAPQARLRTARKHPEFDAETLEYVFDVMISGGKHRLNKRSANWAGFTECHLGADLLLIYRARSDSVT